MAYIYSTFKTAGLIANGASTISNRANSMINGRSYGYYVEYEGRTDFVSDLGSTADNNDSCGNNYGETWVKRHNNDDSHSFADPWNGGIADPQSGNKADQRIRLADN